MESVIAASLEGLTDADRAAIEHVYDVARTVVPETTEGVSYGMAALLYRGRGLVAARTTRAGISLYPFSGSVVTAVAAELTGFRNSTGSIGFDAQKPLPDATLRRIFEVRRDEIDAALNRT